jgi:ABC-type iron transport system FetAB permease component
MGLIVRVKGVGLEKRYCIGSGKDLLQQIVVHAITGYKIALS